MCQALGASDQVPEDRRNNFIWNCSSKFLGAWRLVPGACGRCGRSGLSNSLIKIVLLCLQLLGSRRFAHFHGETRGVVKPHGRLGPLRLEWIAPRPRAAYRRGSLPRPFRRLKASGEFILGRASHLDAFSGYHSRPSLPGVALGRTTGTRAGRPTRSSRTRVRSPQLSNAHDGYRPNCLTTF